MQGQHVTCDRCTSSINSSWYTFDMERFNAPASTVHRDLCQNCTDELLAWMKDSAASLVNGRTNMLLGVLSDAPPDDLNDFVTYVSKKYGTGDATHEHD